MRCAWSRFTRVTLALLAFLLLALFTLTVVWFLLGGKERAGVEVARRLRLLLGQTVDIRSFNLLGTSIVARGITLDPSPTLHLQVATATVRFGLWKTILSGFDWQEAIEEIEIDDPRLTILSGAPNRAAPGNRFIYQPLVLQKARALEVIGRVRIVGGSVASDRARGLLADAIGGQLDLTDPEHVTINIAGRLPLLEGAGFELDGSADLTAGSFLTALHANIPDMAGWPVPDELSVLRVMGGRLTAELQIWGERDLSFGGAFAVSGLRMDYDGKATVEKCDIAGNLFGKRMDVTGELTLNGLPLVLQGAVTDIMTAEWEANVSASKADLSYFDGRALGIPALAGYVSLEAVLQGQGREWKGRIEAASPFVEVRGVRFLKGVVALSAQDDSISIEEADATILGGDLKLTGKIIPALGELDVRGRYERTWNAATTPFWCRVRLPKVSGTLRAACRGGVWQGEGAGFLMDSLGARLLTMRLSGDAGSIIGSVREPPLRSGEGGDEAGGVVEFTFTPKGDTPYHLTARNPHRLLRDVIAPGFVPEALQRYDLNIAAEGDPNKAHCELTADAALSPPLAGGDQGGVSQPFLTTRVATITFDLERSGKNATWGGDLVLRLLSGQQILGSFAGTADGDKVMLRKGLLTSPEGGKLLSATASYSWRERRLQRLLVTADELPLSELLRLIPPLTLPLLSGGGKSGSPPLLSRGGIKGGVINALLDGQLEVFGDTAFWNGSARLLYPDSGRLQAVASGEWMAGRIVLREAQIESPTGDTTYLQAAGSLDVRDRRLDSLVVSLVSFPIERAVEALFPSLSFPPACRGDEGGVSSLKRSIAGIINARLEASGRLSRPVVAADLHLTSGRIQHESIPSIEGGAGGTGEAGYWANIRITTRDSLYVLEQGDLGVGVAALLRAEGSLEPTSGAERLHATGTGIEVGKLIQTLGGRVPLEGTGDFDIIYEGGDRPRRAVGTVALRGGAAGPLSFDRLDARLVLDGLDAGRPSLWFDTLKVDWGDARGFIVGELPLDRERSIDIRVVADGRLTGLLPRLDRFFSHPVGSGTLYLKLGGTIQGLRAVEGRVELARGGFQMKDVLGRVSDIEALVELDREGRIRIRRFDAKLDDGSLRLSNRERDTARGEEAVVVLGYDLGILQIETGGEGFWIVIPGLMEPDWGGRVRLTGFEGDGVFEFKGPSARPLGVGSVTCAGAIFTYPLLGGQGKPSKFVRGLLDLLQRMRWDARVVPERGCRYIREVSGLGELPGWKTIKKEVGGGLQSPDLRLVMDLRVDDNPQGLRFAGSLRDTLRLSGEITSSQGTIELLGALRFQVDRVGLQFNPADLEPILYGRAVTSVVDSFGVQRQVWMSIGSGTTATTAPGGEDALPRARLADMTITLEDNQGHSQEQILALLGYTPEQLPEKLGGLGGRLALSATPLRRWTRMLERLMQEWTGLDRVALESSVAQNLIERQIHTARAPVEPGSEGSYWTLFYGSRLTLGKYVLPNLYLSYTGALARPAEEFNVTRLGVTHDWDLLFALRRISNNLTLNYRLEYDELARSSINSLLVRYSWVFTLQKQFDF